MRRIRLGSAVMAACLALALAACGGDDALDSGSQQNQQSSITIGSTNFSEQLILAQMYAAVLEKAGVDVQTRLNLGAREVVFPALEKGDIDLLPEYTGAALSFLDPEATAVEPQEVLTALRSKLEPKSLVALDPTPAEDKDAFAVTKETAEKYNLQKISDLEPVAGQLVIGGPPELKTRPAGLALKKGDIDVARVFTTQGVIAEEGWVVLQEDKLLEPAQNLIPIGRKDAVTDQISQALNALAPKVTSEELTKLNAQVDIEKKDPETVARDWLTQQGLI